MCGRPNKVEFELSKEMNKRPTGKPKSGFIKGKQFLKLLGWQNSRISKGNRLFSAGRLISILISAVLFAAVIIAMVIINLPNPDAVLTSAQKQTYVRARVMRVLSDDAQPDYVRGEGRRLGTQELEIEILSGYYKGDTMPLTNYLSILANVDVSPGDRIIVRLFTDLDGGELHAAMHNYDRGIVIGAFVLIFALLMMLVGGKKGIMAVLGLAFTLACIWFLMLPLVMRGVPSIAVAIAIVAVTTTASIILLDGFSEKSFSAIMGCVCGVAVAGLAAAITGAITPLNGFNMSDAENLMLQATGDGMKLKGLLVCGVLISALGAVMDVSMSIASAVHEVCVHNPELPSREIMSSGMNVGRDAMGTMANTLILAFAGSSLNMLIMVNAYGIPFIQLMNTDFIVIEILQSVAGSIGIILTVPIVAFISSFVMSRKRLLENR